MSGAGVLIGSIFGIATVTAAEGVDFALQLVGVVSINRQSGASTAWGVGDKIYWDDNNKRATKTATSNTLIGAAVTAAADGDASGSVRLNGSF